MQLMLLYCVVDGDQLSSTLNNLLPTPTLIPMRSNYGSHNTCPRVASAQSATNSEVAESRSVYVRLFKAPMAPSSLNACLAGGNTATLLHTFITCILTSGSSSDSIGTSKGTTPLPCTSFFPLSVTVRFAREDAACARIVGFECDSKRCRGGTARWWW